MKDMRREKPLEARGVRKRYASGTSSVEVLHGVDIDVVAGETVAIVGPSGSGKSTLLHCLAGLERPDAGEVRLMGADITRMGRNALARVRAKHVGFVFQQYNLVPSLSVAENIGLPARLAGHAPSGSDVSAVLGRVGLSGFEKARPAELSGGEAQRVAIARAVVAAPDVVFADEPTGALDTVNGNAVLELLGALAEELGRAVVMVTHDLDAAARADRVLVLRDGRVVRELVDSTPTEILREMEGAR